MKNKTDLQKVNEETMRFMRGKYVLDEVQGFYSFSNIYLNISKFIQINSM